MLSPGINRICVSVGWQLNLESEGSMLWDEKEKKEESRRSFRQGKGAMNEERLWATYNGGLKGGRY